jgi:hypothetical protein
MYAFRVSDFNDPSNERDAMISSEIPSSQSSGSAEGAQFAPNLVVLAILKPVRDRQKDRRETDPSRTQKLIREARAGGM